MLISDVTVLPGCALDPNRLHGTCRGEIARGIFGVSAPSTGEGGGTGEGQFWICVLPIGSDLPYYRWRCWECRLTNGSLFPPVLQHLKVLCAFVMCACTIMCASICTCIDMSAHLGIADLLYMHGAGTGGPVRRM
jgi:hypothetical protein